MNAKGKGSRRERQTMKLLESRGYACTRAAASLGTFDVIAIGPDDVLLCQVKSNVWPRSAEMEAIEAFPCPPGVRKIVHRWKDRAAAPDVREIGIGNVYGVAVSFTKKFTLSQTILCAVRIAFIHRPSRSWPDTV